ncbi:hypothetical protein GEMRC1_001703 [Eukaryota sp. GEM-RC1]
MTSNPVFDRSGIDQLLQAETEAAKMIEEARQMRNQKLLDSKREAEQTIQQLQLEKDQEIDNYAKEKLGGISSFKTDLDEKTDKFIAEMEEEAMTNMEKVSELLLEEILNRSVSS